MLLTRQQLQIKNMCYYGNSVIKRQKKLCERRGMELFRQRVCCYTLTWLIPRCGRIHTKLTEQASLKKTKTTRKTTLLQWFHINFFFTADLSDIFKLYIHYHCVWIRLINLELNRTIQLKGCNSEHDKRKEIVVNAKL